MQWGSIGWATGATFGYAMGLEEDRRLVSVGVMAAGVLSLRIAIRASIHTRTKPS
jgi:TPP-dependent 2-oxoacid decarboxylase